jgi:hypothetical protein
MDSGRIRKQGVLFHNEEVKQGFFSMSGKKKFNWKQRLLKLKETTDGNIFLYMQKVKKGNVADFETIQLKKSTKANELVPEDKGQAFCFAVYDDQAYTFYSQNKEDGEEWLDAINDAIHDLKNARASAKKGGARKAGGQQERGNAPERIGQRNESVRGPKSYASGAEFRASREGGGRDSFQVDGREREEASAELTERVLKQYYGDSHALAPMDGRRSLCQHGLICYYTHYI